MSKSTIKILSLIAAGAVLFVTACSGNNNNSQSSNTGGDSSSISLSQSDSSSQSDSGSSTEQSASSQSGSQSSSISQIVDTRTPKQIYNDMVVKMAQFDKVMNQEKGKPSFLTGYLYVPGTTIDDVVVQYDDNDYFLRKNKYQEENFNGCYFADFRNTFGQGVGLSRNTIIYGHSMDDSPNSGMFSQLKRYLDPEFAKKNQFIYFSTPTKNMVWQVFSAFYTDTNFYYINNSPSDLEMQEIIAKAKSGSMVNFENVLVTPKDNILTLSTCTYRFAPTFQYPNDYRYVVMAKLVSETDMANPSTVSENKNPVLPGKLYN